MANANKDGNSVAVLMVVSSLDPSVLIPVWGDPVTHRILVDQASVISELAATGTVDGINTQFTFVTLPSYIVADGAWYKPLDNNSNVNWSWSAGTLTATMTIPPTSAIFGVA